MQAQLESLLQTAKKLIDEAPDESTLKKIRVSFFGKKGKITELLKLLGEISSKERPKFGKAINEIKHEIQTLFTKKSEQLCETVFYKKLTQEKN